MNTYNIVTESEESTVIAEYKSQVVRSEAYQSEAELEKEFLRLLQSQGYEYISVRLEKDLLDNLRVQLERLNRFQFSDGEWSRFLSDSVIGKNEGIAEKTEKIQNDYVTML